MEKPIAPTYDESLALVEQAEAAGVSSSRSATSNGLTPG